MSDAVASAVIAVSGTLVGALAAGIGVFFTARHQASLKRLEIQSQYEQSRVGRLLEIRKENLRPVKEWLHEAAMTFQGLSFSLLNARIVMEGSPQDEEQRAALSTLSAAIAEGCERLSEMAGQLVGLSISIADSDLVNSLAELVGIARTTTLELSRQCAITEEFARHKVEGKRGMELNLESVDMTPLLKQTAVINQRIDSLLSGMDLEIVPK